MAVMFVLRGAPMLWEKLCDCSECREVERSAFESWVNRMGDPETADSSVLNHSEIRRENE